MKIQELADRMGLSVHTIRYYEKEGLLDERHVERDQNNYRHYSDEAIERLTLVKRFQSVGCSLTELKQILLGLDTNTTTTQQGIEWVLSKIKEIERKKEEYDQVLATLNRMLEYKVALQNGPGKEHR
ncbi:DNA-binding transcriptional regulator, MerR family [Cohnella sp. OV330]|uniref:MerR family transcriptional regulator n=1 Tax=Cohnella sp. OV330 TaxID=1855288 RepID=UPI0008F09DDD|nr:MerR family transcriptional regulator [Cohnella sp. OV330]SFB51960.1 DNA-binding transcriptional regulator, MerR family [Cohnella sp. OV330]